MLFDRAGQRKYLTKSEWIAFRNAAASFEPEVHTFCEVMAHSGARISEVRALTPAKVDIANDSLIFECLKRRRKGVFRAVPVPHEIVDMLDRVHDVVGAKGDHTRENQRIWPWCRTTAWTRVKEVCAVAGVPPAVAMPKAFRHSFGVEGTAQAGVPIGTMKRWLGHSRIESTLVYVEALGREERILAERMWK
ncbi:MAG TPA: site-specific integrase [Pyrinomonadaceae bacterium]|nr:site-specific integrase [Pyrinomonadaceae bacterium]